MNASVEQVRDALAELIKAALISDDRTASPAARPRGPSSRRWRPTRRDAGSVRMDGAWTLAIQEAEAPELATPRAR